MSLFQDYRLESAYTSDAYVVGGDRWPGSLGRTGACLPRLALPPAEAPPTLTLRLRAVVRAIVLTSFSPPRGPRELVVFIHGGYWLELDKSYWSHLAAGSVASGYAVRNPSYTLCPDIRLAGIAEGLRRPLARRPLWSMALMMLVGHSAGGQLATRVVYRHVAATCAAVAGPHTPCGLHLRDCSICGRS